MGMDKSLICYDDASKKTDPYGELKVFAGSSGKGLGRAICDRLEIELAHLRDARFQRGQRFRPRARKRTRARRLHRAGDRLPGQRQLRRAALLDRCVQTRQRDAGHGGHPLFFLCQGRQERRAAGLDPGSRLRRLHRGGGGRPRLDDGPAQPANPGLFQDPRRSPLRDARLRRILPVQRDPRPGRGRAPTSASASRRTSSAR